MLSRIFTGLIAAATIASGLGLTAIPAHAAVECGTTQTRLIGTASNLVVPALGKNYTINVGLYGQYDATISSDFCGALKIIMKVTVPAGGVVTTGHVNLQTNGGDVNTAKKNDAVGKTTTFDSGWVPGNCMLTNGGFGLWVKPGTTTDSKYYTGYGTGSHCV